MANQNEKALRETLAREEARLAGMEIERARLARRIAQLKARLSTAIPQAGSPRKPMRQAALSSTSTPQRGDRRQRFVRE